MCASDHAIQVEFRKDPAEGRSSEPAGIMVYPLAALVVIPAASVSGSLGTFHAPSCLAHFINLRPSCPGGWIESHAFWKLTEVAFRSLLVHDDDLDVPPRVLGLKGPGRLGQGVGRGDEGLEVDHAARQQADGVLEATGGVADGSWCGGRGWGEVSLAGGGGFFLGGGGWGRKGEGGVHLCVSRFPPLC